MAVVFHDLAGFPYHLHLFLGVAVLHEHIDMRQHIECDALGVYLDFDILVIEQRAGLLGQFVDRFFAGAGHSLVCRHIDARDANRILDRLERHQHLHRRAIGIGDNAAVLVLRDGVRIHLRHHQRNIAVIAEVCSVVDHHTAGCRGDRRIFFRHAAARREQADLRFGKVETFHVDDGTVLPL